MRARELIANAGFPPHDLAVIVEGFEDAWAEIGPDVGSDPIVVEAARLSLARIVLEVVTGLPIDRGKINAVAVEAFRRMHQNDDSP